MAEVAAISGDQRLVIVKTGGMKVAEIVLICLCGQSVRNNSWRLLGIGQGNLPFSLLALVLFSFQRGTGLFFYQLVKFKQFENFAKI